MLDGGFSHFEMPNMHKIKHTLSTPWRWPAIWLCLLLLAGGMQAQAQSNVRPPDNAVVNPTPAATPIAVPNPNTDLWNQVRAREAAPGARTQVGGVDTAVLIRPEGEAWRHFRMNELIPMAAMLLALVLGVIVAFRVMRGKIPIQAGRSGKKIRRFSDFQRYVHWTTATLFVLLGVTGLVLLFGRHVLLPIFGPDAFGVVALVCKRIHDFAGPVFAVALAILVVTFIKGNLPDRSDIQWLSKGGGLFGGRHASAGRYNAGEKFWYWFATLGGAVLVVSGLVLDFPNFGQSRETMEYYHMLHGVSAAAVLAFAFGHIYMGTIAMEGAFEAMATGECDENWAKEHHDLWYEEMTSQSTNNDHVSREHLDRVGNA